MSTILKALRRLEREREPDPTRPLQQDVVAYRPGEPQDAPQRPVPLATGAAVVVALGVIGLWLSSDPGEGGPSSQPPEQVRPAAAQSERSALPAPAPPPAPPARGVRPDPPAVAEVPVPRRAEAPIPQPPSAASASSAPSAPPAVAEVAPSEELPYRLPEPTPLAAYQARARQQEVAEVAPTPAPSAPVVEPAPAPPPPATVQGTTWHPDASRRVARVRAPGRDPVSLREGDALGELVILRIEPAAVVFLYRGREVRQAVGGRRATPAD